MSKRRSIIIRGTARNIKAKKTGAFALIVNPLDINLELQCSYYTTTNQFMQWFLGYLSVRE